MNLVLVLFLSACLLHLSSADTHSLQYLYTGVTSGTNFPEFTVVGLVDGEQFVYYDSNIRKMIPKTEWIKNISADDPHYWNEETQEHQSEQQLFKSTVPIIMQRFNQSTGVHTLQRMFGCELDDDGTTRGYRQYGYDGEDFISLDLNTETWIAATPQALITKHEWESGEEEMPIFWKSYLENECIMWLKRFVSYGRETLERKVHPKTSLFQNQEIKRPPPEVVCHATGFFPKAMTITWQKDGEEVHEDVELRETFLNQDGSFQKRSILKVPAEDLQKHKYTCVIHHSSLEKDLVLEVPKGEALIGIIVGVIVVQVAVVAGIVMWKKKKSGFIPVPARASSEGDSSSNNS